MRPLRSCVIILSVVEEPGLTGDIGRLIARLAADETAALHGRAVGDEIEELRSSFLQAREAIDLASLDLSYGVCGSF
jgi:hypothetical protein